MMRYVFIVIYLCLQVSLEAESQIFDTIDLKQGDQSIGIYLTWGDFDSDGDLDFVYESIANRPESVYSVYANQDGAYVKVSEFTALGLAEILVYDHDQDGFLDLLLWDRYEIEVYVNNSLNFALSETQVPGLPPGNYDKEIASITKGSFNNDGLDDLVIVLSEVTSWPHVKLSTDIWANNSGTYSGYNFNVPEAVSTHNSSINVIDIDGDGRLDLQLGQNIAMNKVDGFQLVADAIPVQFAKEARWNDLDNDGDLDLVILFSEVSLSVTRLRVLINNSLSFDALQEIETNTEFLDWVDWDSDGNAEIVTYQLRQDLNWVYDIQFYEYNGTEFVLEEVNPFNLNVSNRAYFVDSDLDGDLDVVTSGPIKYYRNNNHVYDLISKYQLSSLLLNGGGVVFNDMDDDDDDDLLVVNGYRAGVFENNNGEFKQKVTLEKGAAHSLHWADVDNDNDLDYLYLIKDAGAVYLTFFENLNDTYVLRQYAKVQALINAYPTFRLQLLDFDLDGDQDVVVVVKDGLVDHRTYVLINNTNVFSIASDLGLPNAIDIKVLDVNNDQRDDIVFWTSLYPAEIEVLVKTDIGFDKYVINAGDHYIEEFDVFAIDFNNDGSQDLVIYDLYFAYKNGEYSVTDRPLALLTNEAYFENNRINFVYDHDLDGLNDIVSISGHYDHFTNPPASPFRGNLYLWENKGSSVWNSRYKIASELFPSSLSKDKYFYPVFFNSDDYVDFLIYPYESVLLTNGGIPIPTSVKNNDTTGEKVMLSPNPATEKVFFQMPAGAGKSVLSIFTLDGRVILEGRGISEPFYELPISGYRNGVYLYKIYTEAATFSGRFIVE